MLDKSLYNRISAALSKLATFHTNKRQVSKKILTIRTKAHQQKDDKDIQQVRNHIDTLE